MYRLLRERKLSTKLIVIVLMAMVALSGFIWLDSTDSYASSVNVTGKISSSKVKLRESASTSGKSLGTLKKNAKVTINEEIFTDKDSTAAKTRWYYVTSGKKSGYVRSDSVKSITYGNTDGVTTDALNYRTGPNKSYKKLGTINKNSQVTILMSAKLADSKTVWYMVRVGNKKVFICGDYVSTALAAVTRPVEVDLTGRTALAKKLLTDPTSGGAARVVYTFNKNNCQKRFSVTGYKGNYVPQGMASDGSNYYIVFGMSDGQSMVTYSKTGKRLKASKFSFNMGHPNGMTWDPVTKLCYIFRGNQKTIYTWDPATGKFGKSKTPYSSSGVAYSKGEKVLYATSRTGIRIYTAEGDFTHLKLFPRCSHKGKHYIQDCGAQDGFVFHAVSGSNKHSTNYLDIYRAADSKYLGTIKITLGETESVLINNDGYIELLVNHKGTHKDYIWRTPLNIKDLT